MFSSLNSLQSNPVSELGDNVVALESKKYPTAQEDFPGLHKVNAVYVNAYDLDKNLISVNQFMESTGLGGAFHAGVEVYGREYYYSGNFVSFWPTNLGAPREDDAQNGTVRKPHSGIYWHRPTEHGVHVFRKRYFVGYTEYDESRVFVLARVLGERWTTEKLI
jgi:hypothetical protein